MAREQRHDVDYFPHSCIHGRKMHIIEAKFGNDGYAAWFKLLEQLGKANYHYLDISDEMNLMFIVSTFKVEEERAIEILKTLSKIDAIDKFLYDEHKIIYSEKFAQSVKDAYRKRKSGMLEYSALLRHIGVKKDQTGGSLKPITGKQAEVIPKEKERKEKERKEEDNKDIFIDINLLKEKYLKNERLVISFCKNQEIEKKVLKKKLCDFNSELENKGSFSKTEEDYNTHFLSWFRKQKTKSNKNEIHSGGNKVLEKLKKEYGES